MKFSALTGAVLVLMSSAVSARETVEIDGWRIVPSDESCFAMSMYDEHQTGMTTSLSIAYNAKTKLTLVTFSNTKATSIADGAKLNLEIFLNLPNRRYDDGWGTKQFTANVQDEIRFFISEPLEKVLLDDIAKATTIGFFTGGTLVSSFGLDGSAKAIADLARCAFEIAGMNIKDPFLQ